MCVIGKCQRQIYDKLIPPGASGIPHVLALTAAIRGLPKTLMFGTPK